MDIHKSGTNVISLCVYDLRPLRDISGVDISGNLPVVSEHLAVDYPVGHHDTAVLYVFHCIFPLLKHAIFYVFSRIFPKMPSETAGKSVHHSIIANKSKKYKIFCETSLFISAFVLKYIKPSYRERKVIL